MFSDTDAAVTPTADDVNAAVAALICAMSALSAVLDDEDHDDDDVADAAAALMQCEDELATRMGDKALIILPDGRCVVDLVQIGADDGEGRFRVLPMGDVAAL